MGESIRHALARIFLRGRFRDPDLEHCSITVTEVRVSPDLRNATAYVMPLGGADAGPILAALGRATPFIRGRLASELDLRRLPQLRFEIDTAYEQAERIERLLQSDPVRRDLGPAPTEDGGGAA